MPPEEFKPVPSGAQIHEAGSRVAKLALDLLHANLTQAEKEAPNPARAGMITALASAAASGVGAMMDDDG